MTSVGHRGFTFVEVLISVAMAGVLAAIGVPKLFQAQERARHSEVITHLKSIHATLSAQVTKPWSLNEAGVSLPRGNRYSYHAGTPCMSFEDRSTFMVQDHGTDDCIGVDTYAHPTLPGLFEPAPLVSVQWDEQAVYNGVGATPGIFGTETNWDYFAAAAGNRDHHPSDSAETWGIASADGLASRFCPATPELFNITAGEPFLVNKDIGCPY
ncbi:prepilin-type N-terminal cleavage/methylation domain-containing protein [Stigmatella sp. ncwal1]|uniref:Prepilin-type N-terminal cleavage/methylation domain-containing protein n=1 Tax=Stigmatella ashevillensis TaxID=2995309 RepID=A0ABT5D1H9_9BACT|nr:prepilin-type N-terminal cleavage/methylation domain-containing protein [Stigmatella ashevillena]MDC0707436.1 prepilin-type N-terminal cleavage/methylation domain-containing protein [Stigmatella ashevillena]